MRQTAKDAPTPTELAAWLNEHLSYELLMLRHSRKRYSELRAPEQQLDWNSQYEAFVVHARNLHDFLTNDATADIKAHYFFPGGFVATKTSKTMNAMTALNAQVFHMGRKRPPTGPGDKFNTANCEELFTWIEENIRTFVAQLGEPFAEAWAKSAAATIEITVPKITREQLIALGASSQSGTTMSATPTLITTSGSLVRKDQQ